MPNDNKDIILIGAGEMGGVFARGLLRSGYSLHPANRQTDLDQLAAIHSTPEAVLIAVGEADLHPLLERLPDPWRDRVILLQNELLPPDWQRHQLDPVSVISVWFEKKPGQDVKVIIPSPCYGPHAELLTDALGRIGISTRICADPDSLLNELIIKNAYILTSNIAGLELGGTVGELWSDHRDIAEAVLDDVLAIQSQLIGGAHIDRQAIINGMVQAFDGDPQHGCKGRSAPARLQRALTQAEQYQLPTPTLARLAAAHL